VDKVKNDQNFQKSLEIIDQRTPCSAHSESKRP